MLSVCIGGYDAGYVLQVFHDIAVSGFQRYTLSPVHLMPENNRILYCPDFVKNRLICFSGSVIHHNNMRKSAVFQLLNIFRQPLVRFQGGDQDYCLFRRVLFHLCFHPLSYRIRHVADGLYRRPSDRPHYQICLIIL